ncbi:uncharacterized protein LOC127443343 [Myxocyprinus asiaticus]|uniref:uncharacterized protein LOC127443343 n=1 Tax=Myxocyprinus asiaticus TaxID=70543 RepID=UPI002222D707|nr:uncharacterized protein LOC127443343 [Myxocyprinus asiaticus]XP_051557803.1 uncharacterized protein LOC127443343 [Myxocyprinus asiaticus]
MKVLKRKKLFTMWSSLFFFCCVFTAGSLTTVTAPMGGKVTIKCSHFLAHLNIKYFCRETCADGNILIKSEMGERETRRGRYTLHNMGTEFTMTITALQKSDSGTYICAVERLVKDTFQYVTLYVVEDNKITEVSTARSRISTSYSKTPDLNLQSTSITPNEQSLASTCSIVIFIIAGVLLLLLIGPTLVIVSIRMKKQTCDLISSSAEGFCPAFRKGEEIENENVTSTVLPGSPAAYSAETSASDEFHRPTNTEPGNMADPHRDSYYINVSPPVTDCLDQELDTSSRSHVYQCLITDSVQQSVYHSINRTTDCP